MTGYPYTWPVNSGDMAISRARLLVVLVVCLLLALPLLLLPRTIDQAAIRSTLDLHEWYGVLPPLPGHHHPDLHPPNLTVVDIPQFKFVLISDICSASPLALVVLVHSAPENRAARNTIRGTWGRPSIPGEETRLVFLLGRPGNPLDQAGLEQEAGKEGDLVQGDFRDTYHNLSYKNIMGKLWAATFCEQAEFVVKTDDDM